jgi:hypothetical protein
VLGLLCLLIAGWPGLVVGFLWSTVAVYHATFCINSLAHVRGRKRYVTGDDSRNNWILALLTMGEGWHNNHHAYQSSTRQGFRWYEIDITYYILKALSWTGLIWDLRDPPQEIVANVYLGEHLHGEQDGIYEALDMTATRESRPTKEYPKGQEVYALTFAPDERSASEPGIESM